LLRYIPENRSITRAVTRKTAFEKLKINYKAQNKTWTNPQIKNHKKSREVKLIRPQTMTQKSRTHVFKFLTQLRPSVDKIVNLHGCNYLYKPRNYNCNI
jgi:hypothetical protein